MGLQDHRENGEGSLPISSCFHFGIACSHCQPGSSQVDASLDVVAGLARRSVRTTCVLRLDNRLTFALALIYLGSAKRKEGACSSVAHPVSATPLPPHRGRVSHTFLDGEEGCWVETESDRAAAVAASRLYIGWPPLGSG